MLYRDQTDETLVMLTLAGEEKAFEGLVLRYQKAVMAAEVQHTVNTTIRIGRTRLVLWL